MRRDATDLRRMLPQRIRWNAVEDHAGNGVYQERQQVAEHFWRDRDDTVRREQRAEHMSIAVRVRRRELGQHTCRKPEIETDREDMARTNAAADAENQLPRRQRVTDRIDEGIDDRPAGVHDRSPGESNELTS